MEDSTQKQKKSTKPNNAESIEELTARLPIPGPGRPKESEEVKLLRKSRKQLIEEYKDALADALPFINPVLIKKALNGEGDLGAIREINDILVDKAPKNLDLTTKGEPIKGINYIIPDGTLH